MTKDEYRIWKWRRRVRKARIAERVAIRELKTLTARRKSLEAKLDAALRACTFDADFC